MILVWLTLAFFGGAVAAFAIFQIGKSMPASQTKQEQQSEGKPPNQNGTAEPNKIEHEKNKSDYWTNIKKYVEEKWRRIVEISKHNEKAIVAISTVFIAAFTVVLAFSTALLFWSNEKALKATQRAIVTMPLFTTTVGVDPNTSRAGVFFVKAFWENFGPTMALEVEAGITYEKIDGQSVETVVFKDTPLKERQSMSIAPRSRITNGVTIPIQTVVDMWNKRVRFFLLGRTEYKDVFGLPHHTQVCAEVVVSSDPSQVIPDPKNPPPILDYAIWREHNSSS